MRSAPVGLATLVERARPQEPRQAALVEDAEGEKGSNAKEGVKRGVKRGQGVKG